MGCQRFSKTHRILKRPEYLAVKRSGRTEKSRHFLLNWQANGLAESRLGIVATKRVANAVGRNYLKRRIREIFRTNRERLPQGRDLVVIARQGAANMAFPQMEREILGLMHKSDG